MKTARLGWCLSQVSCDLCPGTIVSGYVCDCACHDFDMEGL